MLTKLSVIVITLNNLLSWKWLHGPMDKALVYGTRDSGFDPQWSRVISLFSFSIFHFQPFFYWLMLNWSYSLFVNVRGNTPKEICRPYHIVSDTNTYDTYKWNIKFEFVSNNFYRRFKTILIRTFSKNLYYDYKNKKQILYEHKYLYYIIYIYIYIIDNILI